MAVEVALEDDLFFADLNRQISLLIDDDDDDHHHHHHDDVGHPLSHFHCSTQGLSRRRIHDPPNTIMASHYNLYQQNCRRSDQISKGTGVFIPQLSQPRTKYKQGKRYTQSYSSKSNNNQLVYVKRNTNSPTYNTNFNPSYPKDRGEFRTESA